MRDHSDQRYYWYRTVQMFLAERNGDAETLAQLKAEEEGAREAFLAMWRAMSASMPARRR
jgi:hypothetical protein